MLTDFYKRASFTEAFLLKATPQPRGDSLVVLLIKKQSEMIDARYQIKGLIL